jgi:hypothetical protein
MRFRALLAGAAIVGFLATGIPSQVHADEHPRWGDYDDHHNWRNQEWWMNHHPKWVHHHHPEWVGNGDWDRDHEWHDRGWWKHHDHDWAHHHHPDWF